MEELLKGISDLPIVVAAIVFGSLLNSRYENRHEWGKDFYLIAVIAALGTVLHVAPMDVRMQRGLWVVLYLFLYEALRLLTGLLTRYISQNKQNYAKIIEIGEFALFVLTVFSMFANLKTDIYCVVAYGVICIIYLVMICKKYGFTKNLKLFFALAFTAAVLQALRSLVPYSVVAEHVIIVIDLFYLYKIATE